MEPKGNVIVQISKRSLGFQLSSGSKKAKHPLIELQREVISYGKKGLSDHSQKLSTMHSQGEIKSNAMGRHFQGTEIDPFSYYFSF